MKLLFFRFWTYRPLNPRKPSVSIVKNKKYENFETKQVMTLHNNLLYQKAAASICPAIIFERIASALP